MDDEQYFDEPENLAVHTVLHNKWTFWYLKRSLAKNVNNYDENVIRISSFQTVEHFFRVYDHLLKPNDIKSMDYHLFKNNIKPAWEDDANKDGGKWMVRLKKGLASYYWEELIFSLIGEQFDVGNEICGAVISMRNQEDVISVWNRTADNNEATSRIKEQLRKILKLPSFISIEYRKHSNQPSSAETAQTSGAQPQQQHQQAPRTWNNNSNARNSEGTDRASSAIAKEYHPKERDGQPRTYPREQRSAGDARSSKPPTTGQSNPAWKLVRPAPVNASTGDPARDKEIQDGATALWVKSVKDRGAEQQVAPAEQTQRDPPQAWGAPKEPASAWRGKTDVKKSTAADSAKTWSRGKVAEAGTDGE